MKETFVLRSSMLSAASFDSETNELEVEFRSGKTYVHHNVPQEVADGLRAAGSPGRFYLQNIKGNFL